MQLLKQDGSPLGAKIVLSNATDEEQTAASSGSDSARRKAATICRGGVEIDGLSYLYRSHYSTFNFHTTVKSYVTFPLQHFR